MNTAYDGWFELNISWQLHQNIAPDKKFWNLPSSLWTKEFGDMIGHLKNMIGQCFVIPGIQWKIQVWLLLA